MRDAAAGKRFDHDRAIVVAAKARISSTLLGPSVPGSTGTPAAVAARRAADLLPNSSSVAASGPTKVYPAAAHACANRTVR